MAKGQQKLQETATTRSETQQAAGDAAVQRLENNPDLAAYQARTNANQASIDNGTFADNPAFASNRSAVAQRNNARNAQVNMANTGFGAIGATYADPNQLAQTNSILKDEAARDSALQAEQDKRDFVAQTKQDQENVINKKIGVDSNIAGISYGQSNYNFSQAANIAASRSSLIPGLIGAGIAGAAQVATAGIGTGIAGVTKTVGGVAAGPH